MQQQVKNRLEELSKEFEIGQKKLLDLENEVTNLRHTLLRISGAIQVLGEELEKSNVSQNGHKPTVLQTVQPH